MCPNVMRNLITGHVIPSHSFRHGIVFRLQIRLYAHSLVKLTVRVEHLAFVLPLSNFPLQYETIDSLFRHVKLGADLLDGIPFLCYRLSWLLIGKSIVDMFPAP